MLELCFPMLPSCKHAQTPRIKASYSAAAAHTHVFLSVLVPQSRLLLKSLNSMTGINLLKSQGGGKKIIYNHFHVLLNAMTSIERNFYYRSCIILSTPFSLTSNYSVQKKTQHITTPKKSTFSTRDKRVSS